MTRSTFLLTALFLSAPLWAAPKAKPIASKTKPVPMQLYALDGGHLAFKDMTAFSDTNDYDGQKGEMAVPVFLIHHGKDWMIYDTGVGDRIAALPKGQIKMGIVFSARRTLVSQLAQLGLKPRDIRYVALSHLHADHTGNIGLFPRSTFLVSTAELAWARSKPTPPGVEAALIRPLVGARIESSDDDRDVFGDGSVLLLKTPGHTPGHRMLLLKMPVSGPLMITGDLYHTRKDLEKNLVARGNTNRADTLASFDRFARLRANTGARVIIYHSMQDFKSLPAFPKYLK